MPFCREIYIERDDFMENPPKKFFRLAPDSEVRLKGAYIIKCTGVKKNEAGEIEEIYCTYDPESRSGLPGANRKVKGTLHWVAAPTAVDATVRLYDRLFSVENPSAETDKDFRELLNPDSLIEVQGVKVEPFIAANARKGREIPVPARGIFHSRLRFHSRPSDFQPHHRSERQLGEGTEEVTAVPLRRRMCACGYVRRHIHIICLTRILQRGSI